MATSTKEGEMKTRECTECGGTQKYRPNRGGMWVCEECGTQSVPV